MMNATARRAARARGQPRNAGRGAAEREGIADEESGFFITTAGQTARDCSTKGAGSVLPGRAGRHSRQQLADRFASQVWRSIIRSLFVRDGRRSRRRAGPYEPPQEGEFVAQAAREGAAVAGALLQAVDFPAFVSGLIKGVFHAIVESSIEQMEAYGKLVADVAKSLNTFRDEDVSANQGRDHLVEQFPDLFQVDIDTGEDGAQPRIRLRDGADEDAVASCFSGFSFHRVARRVKAHPAGADYSTSFRRAAKRRASVHSR